MIKLPTISIVTAVRNGADTISNCLASIRSQSITAEHIIVDGCSIDGTLEIVRRLAPNTVIISEPDSGIYDAMNKGINLATGDIIGILNSDDFYCHDRVFAEIAQIFNSKPIDALFADIVYVKPDNLNKIVRYYSGSNFSLSKFASGWMPPHPTFFVRRECYDRFGLFKTDYKIAADFELMARFMVRHRIRYYYFPEVIIKMRTGGISTKNFKSNIILNKEILKACRDNGITTNFFKIYSKYICKSMQLFKRPS